MAEFKVNNKRIVKNTMTLYIRMAITMVISFFTARITLEVLGVDDYGLNNLVGSIVAMFSFINGSMGTAVQRYFSIEIGKGNEDKLKKVFGTGLLMHAYVAGMTFFLAEIFACFFLSKLNIPADRIYAAHVVFQISAISLVLNILSVPYSALLRAREEFSNMAYLEIGQAVLRLLILYALVHIAFDKLILLSMLNAGITLLFLGGIVCLTGRYKESHTWFVYDKELVKGMISFISFLLITVLAQLLRDKGVVLLINIFFGLAVNAAYAVAMQVMSIVNTFVNNFKQSVVPQIMAAFGAGDLKSMHGLIMSGTKITFILMLLISMPIMFEAQTLLELWLKNPPEYSAQLVALVLININFASFTYFLYQGVHATGNVKTQQILMSGLYSFNVLVIYLLFKLGFNFYYGLYSTIVISILQCITNVVLAQKFYEFDSKKFCIFVVAKCVPTVAIIAVLLYGITLVMPANFGRVLTTLAVSTLTICVLGYYHIFSIIEREKIKSMIQSYIKNKNS